MMIQLSLTDVKAKLPHGIHMQAHAKDNINTPKLLHNLKDILCKREIRCRAIKHQIIDLLALIYWKRYAHPS